MNKQIFVVVYCSIFTGFMISISDFQVFYIFFILTFFYIFWFCPAFAFSGFTLLLYCEVFYFFLILSFLHISLYVFRFSISSILPGFNIFLYSQVFYIFFNFMLFVCFIFQISPTSSYRLSVYKMFDLSLCIMELTNVFLTTVMLKDC